MLIFLILIRFSSKFFIKCEYLYQYEFFFIILNRFSVIIIIIIIIMLFKLYIRLDKEIRTNSSFINIFKKRFVKRECYYLDLNYLFCFSNPSFNPFIITLEYLGFL